MIINMWKIWLNLTQFSSDSALLSDYICFMIWSKLCLLLPREIYLPKTTIIQSSGEREHTANVLHLSKPKSITNFGYIIHQSPLKVHIIYKVKLKKRLNYMSLDKNFNTDFPRRQ